MSGCAKVFLVCLNGNPTFPVFMGMGTVSWRRGCLCLVASIVASSRHRCSPRFSFLSLKRDFFFLPLDFLPPLDVQLQVWSCRQKPRLSVHPWGYRTLTHSVARSPSCSIKRGCKWRRQPQTYPVAYAPPLSKAQRPIFRTLSDKHSLLVEPLPVQKEIQKIDGAPCAYGYHGTVDELDYTL